jgi:multidrug resistance efflux pump
VAKSVLAVAIVVIVGWFPVQRFLEVSSTEAVVNARLVTVRSPIDGEVAAVDGLTVGGSIAAGSRLLRIENRRAERQRLDDLKRLISQTDAEQHAARVRLKSLQAAQEELSDQTRLFQVARIKQLEARVAEIEGEIAAAAAMSTEARAALERAAELFRARSGSQQVLERAQREAAVAQNAKVAAAARLAAVQVELDAARMGTFVGDSYNDRPRSSQRADEIGLRIAELSAEIEQRDSRRRDLDEELSGEIRRVADRSSVDVFAPSQGRVWELLTSQGEQVRQGQDLLRLLDCTGAIVTASVSEAVYNTIALGDPAQFRFRGESEIYKGTVIGVSGLAATPANFAILPSSLSKDPYRVAVSVPELTGPGSCLVGRTGKVIFREEWLGAAAAREAWRLR